MTFQPIWKTHVCQPLEDIIFEVLEAPKVNTKTSLRAFTRACSPPVPNVRMFLSKGST